MASEFLAYVPEGLLSDRIAEAESLHDLLETASELALESGTVVPIDDLLVVVVPPGTALEAFAARHALVLSIGSYEVTAELGLPSGVDPARSLLRPHGAFVLLGNARVTATTPGFDELDHPHVWVNRYAVTTVRTEIPLQSFFPGAEMVLGRHEGDNRADAQTVRRS